MVDELVERITEKVRQRLALVTVPEPAYAVAITSVDGIYPLWLGIGLESDRVRALSSLPPIVAFSAVWTADEFPIGAEVDEDAEIAALVATVTAELAAPEATEGLGAEGYVLGRVARRITLDPPVSPVTDDFVAFVAFPGEADDLTLELLRYSTPEDVADRLRAKGLLPSALSDLTGVREWLGDEAADALRLPPT